MTLQIMGTWHAQANVILGISVQIGASEVLYAGPTNVCVRGHIPCLHHSNSQLCYQGKYSALDSSDACIWCWRRLVSANGGIKTKLSRLHFQSTHIRAGLVSLVLRVLVLMRDRLGT